MHHRILFGLLPWRAAKRRVIWLCPESPQAHAIWASESQRSVSRRRALSSRRKAPVIDVAIVATGAPLGGVGEHGVTLLAGALCNAVYAATGQRISSPPLADHCLA